MPSLNSRAMPLAIALLGRRRPSADDIREITRHHWKLVGQLASAGASVTVPIYPVAPRGIRGCTWAASQSRRTPTAVSWIGSIRG